MKLIVLILFIAGFTAAVYLFLVHIKKIDWTALKISLVFGVLLTLFFGFVIFEASRGEGNWCDRYHDSIVYPPADLKTGMNWFEKGNFDYDLGNCKEAINSYTKSIALNPKYPEAFNNRAFTYMQLREYDKALTDLNSALALNPNYVNALMNRGDVYRQKGDSEAAKKDYQKIIDLTGRTATAACGHLFMVTHDTKNILTWFTMPFEVLKCRNGK